MMSTSRPCGASSSIGRHYFADLAPGLPDEEWQWAETHRESAHCIGHLQDTSICHGETPLYVRVKSTEIFDCINLFQRQPSELARFQHHVPALVLGSEDSGICVSHFGVALFQRYAAAKCIPYRA